MDADAGEKRAPEKFLAHDGMSREEVQEILRRYRESKQKQAERTS